MAGPKGTNPFSGFTLRGRTSFEEALRATMFEFVGPQIHVLKPAEILTIRLSDFEEYHNCLLLGLLRMPPVKPKVHGTV